MNSYLAHIRKRYERIIARAEDVAVQVGEVVNETGPLRRAKMYALGLSLKFLREDMALIRRGISQLDSDDVQPGAVSFKISPNLESETRRHAA